MHGHVGGILRAMGQGRNQILQIKPSKSVEMIGGHSTVRIGRDRTTGMATIRRKMGHILSNVSETHELCTCEILICEMDLLDKRAGRALGRCNGVQRCLKNGWFSETPCYGFRTTGGNVAKSLLFGVMYLASSSLSHLSGTEQHRRAAVTKRAEETHPINRRRKHQ